MSARIKTEAAALLALLLSACAFDWRVGPAPNDGSISSSDAAPPPACTRFVSPAGSDMGAGTAMSPYASIQHAYRASAAGDVVCVRQGMYAEQVNFDPGDPHGDSWSSPLIIQAYPGEHVVVRPPAPSQFALWFRGRTTAYIIVSDLVIDASSAGYNGIKITNSSVDPIAAHHIRIQGCEVAHAPATGILINGGSHDDELIGVDVHDNGAGSGGGGGVDLYGGRHLVDRCTVHENAEYGITFFTDSTDTSSSANIVANTIVHGNAASATMGVGILFAAGAGNVAYNNVVYGNAQGMGIDSALAIDNRLLFNTVYGNRTDGIFVGQSQNAIVADNIVYGNASMPQIRTGPASSGTMLQTNLDDGMSDPKFVDASAGDFHLRSGSPAIGAGTAIAMDPDPRVDLAHDFDRHARPIGSAPDLGAFEWRPASNADGGGAD
jgi:parallel beta-helix repeat protein